MNPTIINSANVVQFGYSAVFNIFTKKIIINLTGFTVFGTPGAANIASITFTGKDAMGMIFGPTTVNTGTLAPIEFNLGNSFVFGYYTITGKLIDTSGNAYVVEVTKEVCQPVNWDQGLKQVKGIFEITANCNTASATVYDRTEYSYLKKSPSSKVTSGKLFYPNNALQEQEFEFTPFKVGGSDGLYTGTYRVSAQVLSTYDLGEGVSVTVPYKVVYEKKVDCSGSLKNVMCCIEEAFSGLSKNNYKGFNDVAAYNQVAPFLILALIKDQNGQNTDYEVSEIRKILNCDCGCGENGLVEPSLIGSASDVVVEGDAATNVTPSQAGSSILYTVHSKFFSVEKASPSDPAVTINKVSTGDSDVYKIGFNYEALTTTILNTIQGDSNLLAIFNQFVNIGYQNNLTGLDGKTIIDLTKCSYSFNEVAAGKTVKSILIDSIVRTAPSSLAMSNFGGINTWLNSLSVGTFVAAYDSGTGRTTITSASNTHIVAELKYTISGEDVDVAFTRACPTLKDILQAIIDYLVALTTQEVKLKSTLQLCLTPVVGSTPATFLTFAAGSPLEDYIKALNTKICTLVQTAGKGGPGEPGANGRSVQVIVQPGQPVGTFFNGDMWIVS